VKRLFRLTQSSDFKRMRQTGKSYAHPLMLLVAARSDLPQPRVGVVAGKGVGGAVQRNRAKRLLRAAIQPLLPGIPPGTDLLLIARRKLLQVKCAEAQQALLSLLGRAALLSPHDP
jgi:ribonuclease P protein component